MITKEQFKAAARRHDFDEIAALVRRGGDPDTVIDGWGPLLTWAVKQGQQKLAENLIELRADINIPDAEGNTPLHHAAYLCQQGIVQSLLERQADPLLCNAQNEKPRDRSRKGAKDLTSEFNDTTMSIEDMENNIARYGRIAEMLKDAEALATERRTISSCHEGLAGNLVVSKPLSLKFS